MTTWLTLLRDVADEGKRPDFAGDRPYIGKSACDAIRKHGGMHFFFTERTGNVTTLTGQVRYAKGVGANNIPRDLHRVIGERITVHVNGQTDQGDDLKAVSWSRMDELRRGSAAANYPDVFCLWAGALEIFPPPDADDHVLEFRYIAKPDLPLYVFDGSIYRFYLPNTTVFVTANELPDDWTSDWLQNVGAYQLIKHYTLYLLYSGRWDGSRMQEQKALMRYTEVLAGIETETEDQHHVHQIEPLEVIE